MGDEDEDGCCGCCTKERRDTAKDVFRSGKIPVRTVVTYLQVTAQLSKVYHTQYPPVRPSSTCSLATHFLIRI